MRDPETLHTIYEGASRIQPPVIARKMIREAQP